jgi:hypothetical protein
MEKIRVNRSSTQEELKKRVKPGHLQQIKKKIMGLSFSVKLHLYLTGKI